jgi:hypothetical protein
MTPQDALHLLQDQQKNRNRNRLRLEVLRGDFFTSDELFENWRTPSAKLDVFASSTFTDTHLERNIIMKEILPEARKLGDAHGVPVSVVDMRYGVRNESTLKHMTWIDCYRELKRCALESSGKCFLSLQSHKYGYRPIPKRISKESYESRLTTLSVDLQTLSNHWYIFDENTDSYILRDLADKDDPDFWSAKPKILKAFAGVPFDEDICPGLVVGQSVTECEVQFILSNPERLRRAMWLKRNLLGAIPDVPAGATQEEKDKALSDGSHDDDASSRLTTLVRRMTDSFAHSGVPDAMKSYEISVDAYVSETCPAVLCCPVLCFSFFAAVCPSYPEKQAYLDVWKRDVTAMFTDEVMRIIQEKNQWSSDGCGLGVRGGDIAEMLHHSAWAREKCSDFVGREDLLAQALQAIRSENRNKKSGLKEKN